MKRIIETFASRWFAPFLVSGVYTWGLGVALFYNQESSVIQGLFMTAVIAHVICFFGWMLTVTQEKTWGEKMRGRLDKILDRLEETK